MDLMLGICFSVQKAALSFEENWLENQPELCLVSNGSELPHQLSSPHGCTLIPVVFPIS